VLPNAPREFEGRTDVESPIRIRGEEIDERHRAGRHMGRCLRRDPRFAAIVDHKSRLIDSPVLQRLAETAGLPFTGSLRRQGSIVQPLDRRRNGFLPAEGPRIASRVTRPVQPTGRRRGTGSRRTRYRPGGRTY
jgi:hypothetical protein